MPPLLLRGGRAGDGSVPRQRAGGRPGGGRVTSWLLAVVVSAAAQPGE